MSFNKIFKYVFIIILPFMLFPNYSAAAFSMRSEGGQELAGIWEGTLSVSTVKLRIVFHIEKSDDGKFSAKMDSPDQGVAGIAVSSVTLSGKKVNFQVTAIGGYYEGELQSDSPVIKGEWHQGGRSFPLELKKTDKVEELKRPQEPKPPFPYKSEEVTYPNKAAGIKLAGTLTVPEGNGPFPAVLLITGSGRQNRDEELFGHKPFLVIADYLTRLGIAVLRVDDRGIGGSTGDFGASTSKDFAGDVMAGVEFLKSREEINPKEIGLIGHSEGGMIAPMVAAETNDVAFIVLLAGPGLPGYKLLYLQTKLISEASGESKEEAEKSADLNAKLYDVIRTEKDSAAATEKLTKILNDFYSSLSEKKKKEIGDKDEFNKRQIRVLMSPWFRFFIAYDPVPALEKVKCPVLALDGSLDLQVPPEQDLSAIKKALELGGNKNFETIEIPGLNHLFQTAKTGAPSEYPKIEETFSPKALKIMGDWILKITGKQ